MEQNSVIKSIRKVNGNWFIRYAFDFENFCQGKYRAINEATSQYGFMKYQMAGTLRINVEKILADENTGDVEGLRMVEALVTLASYADGNSKMLYDALALAVNNDFKWYSLIQTLEELGKQAGE